MDCSKAKEDVRFQSLLDFSTEDVLKKSCVVTEMLLANPLGDFIGTKIILLPRKPLIQFL